MSCAFSKGEETLVPTVRYVRGSDWGGGVGGVLYTLQDYNNDGALDRSFNHYNSRGDVVTKTDSGGGVLFQSAYEAFGGHSDGTARADDHTAAGVTLRDRQRKNTKDEDPTGYVNEGLRYYDPVAGVFLTRDPAGFVDGPNLYTYVVQNPWTSFDPLGLQRAYGRNAVNQALLDNAKALHLSDGDIQEIKRDQAKLKRTAEGFATTVDVVASFYPIVAAREVIVGRTATDRKLGRGERILAVAGVFPAGKISKANVLRNLDRLRRAGLITKGLSRTAKVAQKTYSPEFSDVGKKIYTELAGITIEAVDDLAGAIKTGKVDPSDVAVEMVQRGITP